MLTEISLKASVLTVARKRIKQSQLNPCWIDQHDSPPLLLNASDAQGFWNLYATQLTNQAKLSADQFPLQNDAVECAEPPWVFGNNSFVALQNTSSKSAVVAAQHIRRGEGSLVFAHLPADLTERRPAPDESVQWHAVANSGARFECLASSPDGTHLAAIAHYPDLPTQAYGVAPASNR